jgi:hypothetical protein
MLCGQAVGRGMSFRAYLTFVDGWVSVEEMHRVLKNISDCEMLPKLKYEGLIARSNSKFSSNKLHAL